MKNLKHLITILIIFLSIGLFAQNAAPFRSGINIKETIEVDTPNFKIIESDFDFTSIPVGYDNSTWTIIHEHDFGGNTIVLPSNVTLNFQGGKLSNGTLTCDNTFIEGFKGLNKDIILNGSIRGEIVQFDWFDNEVSTQADYDTFINGQNATFGNIPNISDTNRIITKMLLENKYLIYYGIGIYPFDNSVDLGNYNFRIVGTGREQTLLWSPQSSFLNIISGSPTKPYINNISIEANEEVLRTQSNTVNAIHGLMCSNSTFISYSENTFHNDTSVAGGTGCPWYGSKFENLTVNAGNDKGCFTNLQSGSNIYDNVVDSHEYFNRMPPSKKQIPKAIFYNSNVKSYLNSNIAYSGLKYVFYSDLALAFRTFTAKGNVFEEGGDATFQAICKVVNASNFIINVSLNTYVGNVSKENGYKYILNGNGNVTIEDFDIDEVIYGLPIRNKSNKTIKAYSPNTDVGNTKSRLSVYSPFSTYQGINAQSKLSNPTQELADYYGFGDIYTSDPSEISFIEVFPSLNNTGLSLPPLADNAKEGGFRDANTKSIFKYNYDNDIFEILSTQFSSAKHIHTYDDYLYYHPLISNGQTFLILGDVDLDGGEMKLKDDTLFIFLGGSINNGTMTNYANVSTKFINWKGTATLPLLTKDYGTTLNRPTIYLFKGYKYFDTDLDYPIWWNGTLWIDTVPSGVLLKVTQTLSSAQLLSINTTPIEVISAQGAGTVIVVHNIVYKYNYGTVAYSTASTLETEYTGQFAVLTEVQNVIDGVVNKVKASSGFVSNSTLQENTGISVRAQVADPTLGDGTVDVYITYEILTL